MTDPTPRPPAWQSARPVIRWGAYAWALVGVAIAFLLLWQAIGYVRIVVVPLSLALFPAAILGPVAGWLERRRWPPALAAVTVLVGFVAILAAIFTVVGFQIQNQLSGLVDELRSTYEQLRGQLDSVPLLPDPEQLFQQASENGQGAEAAVGAAAALARFATQFFLFLVASFFFIKDRRTIAEWLTSLLPASTRNDVDGLRHRVWDTVGGYIRGQTLIAAFDGVFVAIGLMIVGIPLAGALGAVVFFGAFVPVVGSITAGAVAVLVALVTEGLVPALITLAIVVGVQQVEGNVLAPVVLGHEVALHPLAVLAAIVAGAALLGVWGAIIAVPLAASIHRVAGYVRANQRTPAD